MNDTPTLNVVAFPGNNLNDVPLMARKFTDDVEAGKYGEVRAVVLAVESTDGFSTFGWGDADDPFRVVGLLTAGAQSHVNEVLG
jgi:hypothetical protein